MTEWSRAIPVAIATAIASVQVAGASVMGLPAVLPVSGQCGMVLTPVGSAWPLRGLGADKELTAWDLA